MGTPRILARRAFGHPAADAPLRQLGERRRGFRGRGGKSLSQSGCERTSYEPLDCIQDFPPSSLRPAFLGHSNPRDRCDGGRQRLP